MVKDVIWMIVFLLIAGVCIAFVANGMSWWWAISACAWTAAATLRLAKIAVAVALEERN